MKKNIQTVAGASFGLLALLSAIAAEAAGGDCRRIPVYSARCFSERGPGSRCRTMPDWQAPCFVVRGNLRVYNGTPSLRLFPLRSHRILGVFGGDGDAESLTLLPKSVDHVARSIGPGPFGDVLGDFRVCPMASELAGWMRPVCIESASRMTLSTFQTNVPGGRLPSQLGHAASR
jgi:hypothetical protein